MARVGISRNYHRCATLIFPGTTNAQHHHGRLGCHFTFACATTQREEVRNDREHLEEQREELRAAERDGTINEVREEREDVREARQELRKDQKELYRPGVDAAPGAGLQVGQEDTGDLYAVPVEYRDQYRDGDGSYYRFDGERIYQIGVANRNVIRVHWLRR